MRTAAVTRSLGRSVGGSAPVLAMGLLALVVGAAPLVGGTAASADPGSKSLDLGRAFTFLFMTIGPLKLFGPFAALTQSRHRAFRIRLALLGTGFGAVAAVAAATVGRSILDSWGVSTGALKLAGAIVLFLVALRSVLEQYSPVAPAEAAGSVSTVPARALALSPLAFPAIITPYGVAVIVLGTVVAGAERRWEFFGVIALVLLLDLVAMLTAHIILRAPGITTLLGILGAVMAFLQIAMGVQAGVDAIQSLGVGTAR
jgi:multiple antibiotic resistance protein